MTSGHTRGSRSSTLVSSTTSRVVGADRVGDQEPEHVGVALRVASARAAPHGAGRHRRLRPLRRRRASSAAPLRSACTARPVPVRRTTARRAAARPPRAAAPGARRAHRGPSRADRDRADHDLGGTEVGEARAHPDDVGDRVERTHLVEVHVERVVAVHRGLRDGEPLEDPERVVLAAGQQHRPDVAPGPVVRPSPTPRRGPGSRRTRAGSPTPPAGSRARGSPRRRPPAGPRGAPPRRRAPRAACRRWPPRRRRPRPWSLGRTPAPPRATRAAKTPAPYPLSMLTTVTPGAHELSIASRAATPPNEAPYPTLVGTATSGTPVRPPTTDGRAPSMPATTTRQSAASRRSRTASSRWRPATPTSSITSAAAPCTRMLSAASAATGASLVPAETTATVPRASGNGPSVAARATASTFASGSEVATCASASSESLVASTARSGCRSCSVRRIATTWPGVLPSP